MPTLQSGKLNCKTFYMKVKGTCEAADTKGKDRHWVAGGKKGGEAASRAGERTQVRTPRVFLKKALGSRSGLLSPSAASHVLNVYHGTGTVVGSVPESFHLILTSAWRCGHCQSPATRRELREAQGVARICTQAA